ncbi:SGNH/GDSL hydrolase family protein [Aquicella siphonis]|uniref:SGNH/GDSL hydrolase family protein n=1 Tax=Aquicella siphonis TaxID=254247 RepID=UPI00155AFB7D|nr:SGNH/GDSL hydrolase family protein [Aquicella siphonis]
MADEVITDSRFKKRIQNSYTLDNDLHVQYQGRDFVRSYDEGGLTSHDYSWVPSTSVSRFFSRLILSTLSEKRQKLMEDDHRHAVTKKQKSETLVVEWSGANDLITVNREPSRKEADRAIRDRIRNAEKLIASGYRNFVLFNLPDLSLTPRYQNKTGPDGENERKNAHEVSLYFNDKLKRACKKLRRKYPQCKIDVFDVCSTFTDIYNDTKNQTHKYPGHFEKDKLTTPFTSEKPEIRNNLSPATGYMFWDDVHPTADMHALLGNEFYKKYRNKFHFTQPVVDARSLCEAFKKKYNEKLGDDLFGLFGLFRNANPPRLDPENPSRSITIILRHALYEGGGRTKKVIMELGWIDDKGKINVQIPALKIAKAALDSEIFARDRKSPHRRS